VGCSEARADSTGVRQANPAEEHPPEVQAQEQDEHEEGDDQGEFDKALTPGRPLPMEDSMHAASIEFRSLQAA
jgi:hypothetical protein